MKRDKDMYVKVQAKMAVHQKDLDVLQEKLDAINAQYNEKKASLQQVEAPIKKLMDDKFALQKKLDQATLDRCSKYLSKHSDERISFIL